MYDTRLPHARLLLVAATSCVLALSVGATGALTPAASTPIGIPLPTGRALTPAGTLVTGGDYPASAVYTGGGFYAADNGQSAGSVEASNPAPGLATTFTVPSTPLTPPPTNAKPTANSGLITVSVDGKSLYLPGAALGILHTFAVGAPGVAPVETSTVPITGAPKVWGAAPVADGSVLLSETFSSSGVGPSGDQGDTVIKVNPTSGAVLGSVQVGREPFGMVRASVPTATPGLSLERVVALDRESNQLSVIDPATMTVSKTVTVRRGPSSAVVTPDGRDLLVTCSLDDVLLDLDTTTWEVKSSVSLRPIAGLGAAPGAIALDPAGTSAFVTFGDDNALAVLGRQPDGTWVLSGEIPTATDPTGVAYAPATALSAAQLYVTDGKGTGLPVGTPIGVPDPATNVGDVMQTGTGLSGSLESIPVPTPAQLQTYSAQVRADDAGVTPTPGCPVPGRLAGITHVVYVIRENKTYDEEFGDTQFGDPGLVMYPQAITPNTHAIAMRSALLGNFYSDEEVSDTGHAAVMGGVANDFLERTTQQSYGLGGTQRQGPELGNDDDTNWSPSNFLFDDALSAGLSFRDYGEFYRKNQFDDSQAVTPALQSHIVRGFPGFGFDPNMPDTKRIAYWAADFAKDVLDGTFPSLEVLYLPYDHTTDNTPTATQPIPVTPQQEVADSDLATGQLVQDLSASPYWNSTAVFLTEDDPQSGEDHVDDHRTIGLVTGGRVINQATTEHFDSGSMLRTMEEILGLPAMTEFDASAPPMDDLFAITPDPVDSQPYTAAPSTLLTALTSAPAPALAHTSSTRTVKQQADSLSSLSSAAQFEIQWKATHGSEPVPAAESRPAWAQTTPTAQDAAGEVTPGSCAAASSLPEAGKPIWLPLAAAGTLLLGFTFLGRRRRRASEIHR